MSWDDAEEASKGAGAGGDFLKLEDGEQARIAVVGEPVPYTAKPFEGREGSKPTPKILLRVFNLGTKTLQVWDMAGATFQGLLEVTGTPTKPGKFPLDKWTYTVKRKGTAKKTRYTVLPEKELNDAQKKYISEIEPPPLEQLAESIEYREEAAERPARERAPLATAPQTQLPLPEDADLPF